MRVYCSDPSSTPPRHSAAWTGCLPSPGVAFLGTRVRVTLAAPALPVRGSLPLSDSKGCCWQCSATREQCSPRNGSPSLVSLRIPCPPLEPLSPSSLLGAPLQPPAWPPGGARRLAQTSQVGARKRRRKAWLTRSQLSLPGSERPETLPRLPLQEPSFVTCEIHAVPPLPAEMKRCACPWGSGAPPQGAPGATGVWAKVSKCRVASTGHRLGRAGWLLAPGAWTGNPRRLWDRMGGLHKSHPTRSWAEHFQPRTPSTHSAGALGPGRQGSPLPGLP